MPSRHRRSVVTLTCAVLLVAGCSGGGDGDDNANDAAAARERIAAFASADAAPFSARGGIRYAYVLDAKPGAALRVVDGEGRTAGEGKADRLGSLIFRELEPGDDYRVVSGDGTSLVATEPFPVLSEEEVPDPSLYDQTLEQGLNYVTVRDGIELAMTVRLPSGKTLADGPFPTVIEYSGYQVAAPNDLLNQVLSGQPDPLAPESSTAVGSLIAPQLGFATVSVQMRGSGCSGGDFDLFDLPSIYDGYDAVETVAAQDWVKGNKVGLVGISFSGISQVYVAGTRPPSLAAITPLSVLADLYEGIGYPGGIRNSGFAASWLDERAADAQPAPEGGQAYARALVEQGDERCLANQKLRLQTRDGNQEVIDHPFRDAPTYEKRSPAYWAKRIDVPVYLVGAFQDEQTGGHFAEMIPALTGDDVYVTLTNGTHVDSLGPAGITRWAEFLDLFLADETPTVPASIVALSDALYLQIASAPSMKLPEVRFTDRSAAEGRTAFREQTPRVRILFDNGGGDPTPGALAPQWELGYDQFPPSEVTPSRYYFGSEGRLGATAASATSEQEYRSDPSARPAQTLHGQDGSNAWLALPNYDWPPVPDGTALSYVSEPFSKDTVMAGTASADLYLKSSAPDTDLQVTITEVRPDGTEMYVQSGWLRASHRALDEGTSSELDPQPTHLEQDAAPLPEGEATLVRVSVFPFAHAFREGSRIRIIISAPGGDRAIWQFDTIEKGDTRNTVVLGGAEASSIVLPVLDGVKAGGPLPPCPSNRGQPCRPYQEASSERPSA